MLLLFGSPVPATPRGFRAPFPWIWGMMGGTGSFADYETTGAPTGEVSVFSATTCTISVYTYSQAEAQVVA